MTLRLLLLRHAKSSWDDHSLDDHERALNARGRRSCDVMGPWFVERGYVPDQVLCSSATRTCETWERLAAHMPKDADVSIRPDLYLSDPHTLFHVLAEATGNCVALLAHNPGISAFARQLVKTAPAHPQFTRYPTLASSIIDFEIPSWADLEPGTGNLRDFIVPRELTH